jgi:hypothetical protein
MSHRRVALSGWYPFAVDLASLHQWFEAATVSLSGLAQGLNISVWRMGAVAAAAAAAAAAHQSPSQPSLIAASMLAGTCCAAALSSVCSVPAICCCLGLGC